MAALYRGALAAALVLFSVANAAAESGGKIVVKELGKTNRGEATHTYTLTNASGASIRLLDFGATLMAAHVPDRDGTLADVLFGFDDIHQYQGEDNQYFGCVAGRCANRIAKGRFELDGKTYQLAINNEPNHLHGGDDRALSKVVWDAAVDEQSNSVTFSYTSPDGEEGYPGEVTFGAKYTLTEQNAVVIELTATTDRRTIVNPTNHAYFNLAGAGAATINDHVLTLYAEHYTPTDDTLIPTGQIAPVAGTPLDFREPTAIGARVDELTDTPSLGYDHNVVLSGPLDADGLRLAARLHHPESGRTLVVRTDQPGLQFYGGNFLNGQCGKDGKTYAHRSGLCLETQHHPNSPNQPSFPSIVLEPGDTYSHKCVYAFSAD